MRRIGIITAAAAGLLLLVFLWNLTREEMSDPLVDQLRGRLEGTGTVSVTETVPERLREPAVLKAFYLERDFRPLWSSPKGPMPRVESFLQVIRSSDQDGLRPQDYHLSRIDFLLSRGKKGKEPFSVAQRLELEILLTDAFILCGKHLLNGRVDPHAVYEDWFNLPSRQKEDSLILAALSMRDVEKAAENLRPSDAGYQKLRRGIALYEDVQKQGGWPSVPDGPKLKAGDRSGRVPLLRKRLALSGDLAEVSAGDPDLFDEELDKALRLFQHRHGLLVDGVLSTRTLGELNVPVEKRIRQMRLNMERLRWLPRNLGDCYILVNVAGFTLDVMEKGEPVMNMKIIVGKDEEDQRTFLFAGNMTYLELNPYWNVPESITVNELIPKVKKNPGYLASQGMRILDGWSENAREIAPGSIDWESLDPEKFRYRLRQDPGPKNPLGRIKFMFINEFSIYLHDTPTRSLFQRDRRTFSHGCIRIEKPIELAAYLLKNEMEWSEETILAEIAKKKRQVIKLTRPVPVYIYYMTAWADSDGFLHFRKDVYRSDRVLEKAMGETS
jgi:murein L,D-transpeptidase YcbB/YkuD